MFDFPCESGVTPIDGSLVRLNEIVSTLSDADLAALEDDLDFYCFAHMPSVRMLRILDLIGTLDGAWRQMLLSQADLELPAAA